LLRYLIAVSEEVGLDERFLRLIFFDVSEVGKAKSCTFKLPYFDSNTFTQNYHCSFDQSWLFWVGYLIIGYQLMTLLLVRCWLKRLPTDISLAGDFMMVAEEVFTVLMMTGGLCFGFYKDLMMISLSIYLMLTPRRISLEGIA